MENKINDYCIPSISVRYAKFFLARDYSGFL